MKKIKETLKTIGKALKPAWDVIPELVGSWLVFVGILGLLVGEYFQALQSFNIAMLFAVSVYFLRASEKYRDAYRELWAKLVSFHEIAQSEGKKLVVKYNGVDTINLEREGEQPKVLPSEAVYGLLAWLSAREEAVVFSSKDDASVAADIAKQYCEAQGYENPRDGYYPGNIVAMGGKSTWHATATTSEPEEGKTP